MHQEERFGVGRHRPVMALHAATGRMRFKVSGLYRSEALKQHLEQRLGAQDGIHTATASTLTGNLLIMCDRGQSVERLLRIIEEELPRPPAVDGPLPRRTGTGGRRYRESPLTATQPMHPWHGLSSQAVEERLQSTPVGLNSVTARERRARYGANRLPRPRRRSEWDMFFGQFTSAPVALLGFSAVISLATGGVLDAVIIAGVVGVNGVIGFLTERQAERTIRGLDILTPRHAIVLRDGEPQSLPAEQVTLGDVLLLAPGTYVPADGRLLAATRLSVDESALTGESMPVIKNAHLLVAEDSPLAARYNMVYMGTMVTGGSGLAMVTATGRVTEIGTIQSLTSELGRPATPMERQLEKAGRQLALLSSAICGGLFALGLLRGFGLLNMLKASISLAVAAVPEGLPAVATTTLAMGVRNMSRRQALIRHIDAVETLGSVQVFCLDKTGTLTQNRMTVMAVYSEFKRVEVDSEGFSTAGVRLDPARSEALLRLLQVVCLCSEAEVNGEGGEYVFAGSPTETALLDLARMGGVDVAALRRDYPRRETEYRSEQRPYMCTVHESAAGRQLYAVKGSPAEVLALCRYAMLDGEEHPLEEAQRSRILEENDRMAGEALRVLGVAFTFNGKRSGGLTWLGLVGMADPLRPGIAELMDEFHRAGIDTIMITGDQSVTAYAVGRQLNLSNGKGLEILDSTALEKLEPELLAGLVRRTRIFARVSPANKLQIVQALQRSGKVVAMTGDGINDGPALKASDIGVAMGSAGTDVARSVADVVLQDDDLRTMVVAVRQGRTTYDNVRKAIHYLLATNLSEIEVMLAGVALGRGAPLSPMQLLWINLITDIFPALALALEPPEEDVMMRAPRDPKEPILGRREFERLGRESAIITAGAVASYAYGVLRYGTGAAANTHAFMSLTVGQIIHAISCRSRVRSIYTPGKRPTNPYLNAAVGGSLALQVATVLVPGLRRVLGLTALAPVDGLVIGTGAVLPLLVNEAIKVRPPRPAPPRHENQTSLPPANME